MSSLSRKNITLETVGFCAAVAGATLVGYYFWFGKRHSQKRQDLEKQLLEAQQAVRDLEEKLLTVKETDIQKSGKEIRIWMDGAFDMMHYGHMNAFRQGRALGTYLIVGVNSDETITACKGKPVCAEKERIETVKGCKFVDEVVEGVPYIMNDEYLNYVIEKYRIDFVVHGDDPCIVNGKDVYESARKLGKYLTIPRTEGISTTDIVGRMLLMTKSHHSNESEKSVEDNDSSASRLASGMTKVPFDRKTNFLTTSRTIRLFGANVKAPKPTDKVVYLAGAWDMFHAGHIETLKKAKQFGDYVIVGVHNDNVVNQQRGSNLPIMNLHERVLSVLGCKYVDDVLIDAPYIISQEMISSLKIDVVLKGSYDHYKSSDNISTLAEANASTLSSSSSLASESGSASVHREPAAIEGDMYALPKKLGILKTVESSTTFSGKWQISLLC